jgi:hypothetical protein
MIQYYYTKKEWGVVMEKEMSFFARKSKVSLKISLKFPLALFDYSEGCFANCLLNSIFGIDICLCD